MKQKSREYYYNNKEAASERCKKYREENREALAEKGREYTQKNKDKIQSKKRESSYGLSKEKYDLLVKKQENKCLICNEVETAKNQRGEIKPLAVDHCHSTGIIRGLLCHKCNSLLGFSKDNIEILKKAISYLEEDRIFPKDKCLECDGIGFVDYPIIYDQSVIDYTCPECNGTGKKK
ncbi:MAG: endonuclease VII domain-containing protein [Thaumarchaeota archaeon]|nr:endonuclease VII domain-containing protein [Nitrososphaerota archaeon]